VGEAVGAGGAYWGCGYGAHATSAGEPSPFSCTRTPSFFTLLPLLLFPSPFSFSPSPSLILLLLLLLLLLHHFFFTLLHERKKKKD
jgi:hypothetical protein